MNQKGARGSDGIDGRRWVDPPLSYSTTSKWLLHCGAVDHLHLHYETEISPNFVCFKNSKCFDNNNNNNLKV